jgi:hypothetical protein
MRFSHKTLLFIDKFQWYNPGERRSGLRLATSTKCWQRPAFFTESAAAPPKLNWAKKVMLDKLAGIEERYEELNQLLMEAGSDYQRAAELNMERTELEPIVSKARLYRQALSHLDEAHALLESEDEEMRLLAEAEISELGLQIEGLEQELKTMLLPTDSRDKRNVIVEIRAGTGGEEAAIFAADLFRMYSRYAERQSWAWRCSLPTRLASAALRRSSSWSKGVAPTPA